MYHICLWLREASQCSKLLKAIPPLKNDEKSSAYFPTQLRSLAKFPFPFSSANLKAGQQKNGYFRSVCQLQLRIYVKTENWALEFCKSFEIVIIFVIFDQTARHFESSRPIRTIRKTEPKLLSPQKKMAKTFHR